MVYQLLLRRNNGLKFRLSFLCCQPYQASVIPTLALLVSWRQLSKDLLTLFVGCYFIVMPAVLSAQSRNDNLANITENSSNDSTIILVGLFVNDSESANIDALKNTKGYYLPLQIAIEQLGITPTETANEWQFQSPLGDANISKKQLVNFQNQAFVPLDTFKPLGVNAVYDQSTLAIKMYVPWDSKNPFSNEENKGNKTAVPRTIDYYPQTFGLGGISISGGVNHQMNNSGKQRTTSSTNTLQMGLTGYLSGGLWGANLQYDYTTYHSDGDSRPSDNAFYINNLYWTKTSENWAMRLGTNTNSYGLSVDDYTGATLTYSNKGIKKYLTISDSGTSQLLASNLSGSGRNIKGRGPAGGIAELRIDGRPIARVRIALDEKYEFIGLNLDNYSNDSYNVEVAIFEYSLAEPPIKIEKPNLYSRRSNVGTDELLLEAGAGHDGNWFDQRDELFEQKAQTVAHAYAEYGLTNNIAVRGAWANQSKPSNDNDNEHLLGINVGFPLNFNVDLSYARRQREKAYEAYVDFNSKYVDVNYNYRYKRYENQLNNNAPSTFEKQDEQNLNIRIRSSDKLSLGLHGIHKQTDNQPAEYYFTASLYARLHNNVSLNINKDRYNNYRYGINWHIPEWQTHINADWGQDSKALRVTKQLHTALDIGVSATQWDRTDTTAYRTSLNYQHNEKHKFYAGIGHHGDKTGYDVNWRYRPNNYGLISLGYRKNQSVYEQNIDSPNKIFNESDYFYLQFNFDFINTQYTGIDFGRYRPSYYGTVVTNLSADDPSSLTLGDKVQLKLDDYSVEGYKITDNQYRIENVKPGVYTLAFPTDNLPLEYQNDGLPKPTIKVAESAPTVVNYQLTKTFGVSGQLMAEKQGVIISVYQAGKKITETRTGAYGYYQIIGLPAGDYAIQVAGGESKTITISEAFLFEVDL